MTVFAPNLTSKLLLKVALENQSKFHDSVLELGCGSGWITENILKSLHSVDTSFYLSDISLEAIDAAKSGLTKSIPEEHFRVGSGLAPWVGRQFDFIINDIAGIADEISAISTWYEGVPFDAGSDGLANTRKILEVIPQVLKPHGVFIAPVISLSDVAEYYRLLEQTFKHIVYLYRTWWPMPESIIGNRSLLEKLESVQSIKLKEKYGRILAFTEVAVCEL